MMIRRGVMRVPLSTDVPLLEAWQDWDCPACGAEDRAKPPPPPNGTRLTPCPRLHGLTMRQARAGTDRKMTAGPGEDQVGAEGQRTRDDGRPYMSVITEHA